MHAEADWLMQLHNTGFSIPCSCMTKVPQSMAHVHTLAQTSSQFHSKADFQWA